MKVDQLYSLAAFCRHRATMHFKRLLILLNLCHIRYIVAPAGMKSSCLNCVTAQRGPVLRIHAHAALAEITWAERGLCGDYLMSGQQLWPGDLTFTQSTIQLRLIHCIWACGGLEYLVTADHSEKTESTTTHRRKAIISVCYNRFYELQRLFWGNSPMSEITHFWVNYPCGHWHTWIFSQRKQRKEKDYLLQATVTGVFFFFVLFTAITSARTALCRNFVK